MRIGEKKRFSSMRQEEAGGGRWIEGPSHYKLKKHFYRSMRLEVGGEEKFWGWALAAGGEGRYLYFSGKMTNKWQGT